MVTTFCDGTPVPTIPEPDANGFYQFEYVDREHWDMIGIGTFEKCFDGRHTEEQLNEFVGRRVIAPQHLVDGKTGLPILATIDSAYGYHLKLRNLGSWIDHICFVETL
jgi:hypothetical protein